MLTHSRCSVGVDVVCNVVSVVVDVVCNVVNVVVACSSNCCRVIVCLWRDRCCCCCCMCCNSVSFVVVADVCWRHFRICKLQVHLFVFKQLVRFTLGINSPRFRSQNVSAPIVVSDVCRSGLGI